MTIETIVRFVVRFVALFVLAAHWTYVAGRATGRFVHAANDWLTAASKTPLATATRLASAALAWAETASEPTLMDVIGAEPLTDEQLEAEIAAYNERVMPGIAEIFAANCAEMAASDARLYRQTGERIANIRALLDEAEAEPAPAKPKRVARRKPAASAEGAPAKPKRASRRKPAEAPKAEAAG